MRFAILIPLALLATAVAPQDIATVAEALQNIYHNCSESESTLACAKPKVLGYLSHVAKRDRVYLTRDLVLAKSSEVPAHIEDVDEENSADPDRQEFLRSLFLDKLDAYLSTHHIEAKLPEALLNPDLVPRSLADAVPRSLKVPLVEAECSSSQGRGFVKKVVIPFLLGLKFKATALVPLALALIALKTWKALTLGLLSIVLSGALMIFKLTKPKIAYEVVHYGHPPVEHAPHWETSPTGPYRAYRK